MFHTRSRHLGLANQNCAGIDFPIFRGGRMKKRRAVLAISALGLIAMFLLGSRMLISAAAQSSSAQVPGSVAAVAGQKGDQDIFGAYEPVANSPQDLSELPGHEKWTWGSVEGVFAESPNRVFIFQRGELPNIPMPKTRRTPEFGPSLAYPLGEGRVPMRNATTASTSPCTSSTMS